MQRSAPDLDFEPARHRRELVAIIREIETLPAGEGGALDPVVVDRILRRYPRAGTGFFSRSELIAGYRALAPSAGFGLDEAGFVRRVQRRPVRSQSGVTPLTVLTRPHPCPGRCVFCPSDVRMPKSYLADEPGAQRAATHHFDPYLQTWSRLEAYRAIGHPTDKIELIVLGGTWSFYPEAYQIGFARRCFEALNDFGAGVDRRAEVHLAIRDFATLARTPSSPHGRRESYNQTVAGFLGERIGSRLLADSEASGWAALEAAQRANEEGASRCVGFVVETRPDHVTPEEVLRMRRLGATKVQIGIQSLDDELLRANRRGHDVAATRRAMALLRGAGFKIHAHWMPNLLGATPDRDSADYARLFEDPDFRPDELKLYPCSLVESAELMDAWRSGDWRPYEHAELLEVVTTALAHTPRWCRLTRVVRDISSHDIVTGNKRTNFRQIAERELVRRGGRGQDIRAREIRGDRFELVELRMQDNVYESSTGREHFLEFVTDHDVLVAFLRLTLPRSAGLLPELAGSALLREVHVYGAALGLGERCERRAQHRGLGARLVEEAARLARLAGHRDLAVISAVGTRAYYRRLGFRDGELYQHLDLVSPLALQPDPPEEQIA
jgi:elongator complex protein 3